MTWERVAADHIGHRCVLDDPRTLRCVDCGRKLILPKEPAKVAVTGPPPYRYQPPAQPATPELVELRKREVAAALEAARQKRTTVEDPS